MHLSKDRWRTHLIMAFSTMHLTPEDVDDITTAVSGMSALKVLQLGLSNTRMESLLPLTSSFREFSQLESISLDLDHSTSCFDGWQFGWGLSDLDPLWSLPNLSSVALNLTMLPVDELELLGKVRAIASCHLRRVRCLEIIG